MSIAAQVAILFLVVLVGVLCRRLGYFTDETIRGVTQLVVNVTLPVLTVYNMQRPFDMHVLTNFLLTLLLSLAAILAAIGGASLLFRHRPHDKRAVLLNMAGFSIVDDEVCREASRQEVIRRYFQAACRVRQGQNAEDEVAKIELLMRTLDIEPERRAVVPAAMAVAERTGKPALAIELPDGQIVTGRTTELFGAASAAVLNALKAIAGIDDEIKLIAPDVIASIQTLKTDYMKSRNPRLHTDEMLVALAISAASDPNALKAMQALDKLKCCEVHSTVILSSVDDGVFKRLGMRLTCEPVYEKNSLYHK